VVWAHFRAHLLGESRGWSRGVRFAVNRALVILLTHHRDDDVIHYSEMFPALRAFDLSVERTADVLEQMGVLIDDRQPSFEQWLPRKLDGIAPGIANEAEAWLRLLHEGEPRSRPRSTETVWQYLNLLRSVLLAWSARVDHPREITRQDVLAALDDLHGVRGRSTSSPPADARLAGLSAHPLAQHRQPAPAHQPDDRDGDQPGQRRLAARNLPRTGRRARTPPGRSSTRGRHSPTKLTRCT
jgi:hypothetical protein